MQTPFCWSHDLAEVAYWSFSRVFFRWWWVVVPCPGSLRPLRGSSSSRVLVCTAVWWRVLRRWQQEGLKGLEAVGGCGSTCTWVARTCLWPRRDTPSRVRPTLLHNLQRNKNVLALLTLAAQDDNIRSICSWNVSTRAEVPKSLPFSRIHSFGHLVTGDVSTCIRPTQPPRINRSPSEWQDALHLDWHKFKRDPRLVKSRFCDLAPALGSIPLSWGEGGSEPWRWTVTQRVWIYRSDSGRQG